MKFTKQQVIEIAEALGFKLDYDQWDVKDKGWIRFILPESLDEQDLRLILHKGNIMGALEEAGRILFQAGQKAKVQQFNKEYINL